MDQQPPSTNTAIETRLAEIEKTLAENTKILIRMRSAQQVAMALRALYWVIIFLIGFGAFYFVKPLLGQLESVYSIGGKSDISTLKGIIEEYRTITK